MPWENQNSKRHLYLNAHCSTIYNSQDKCFQRGHGACLCLMSWCLSLLGCLILFPHKFMRSWRRGAVSFCHQWGAPPRTCGYECLLNECSNLVWLAHSVYKGDRKPLLSWKSEVVMKCVVLVSGQSPRGALYCPSMWGLGSRCFF